jgi:ubiquinone/menaquinone biosynthesis C-methylase UbiE
MKKVDLGAGFLDQNKIDRYVRHLGNSYNPDDYIGIDFCKRKGVDEVCNFEYEKLPFGDSTIDEIITIHTLEHINGLTHIIGECHRILKHHGLLKIWVPHCHSTSAFSEPTHVRFFAVSTLDPFDYTNKQGNALPNRNVLFKKNSVKLQICRNGYSIKWIHKIFEIFINRNQRKGERWLKGLPYKDWEIYYELKKV